MEQYSRDGLAESQFTGSGEAGLRGDDPYVRVDSSLSNYELVRGSSSRRRCYVDLGGAHEVTNASSHK